MISTSSQRSNDGSSTAPTSSFPILVTTFFVGTICVALLLLPRASSFGLCNSNGRKQHSRHTTKSMLFQSTAATDSEQTTTSTLLMEAQAGGNSSNRRRRKQRIKNNTDNPMKSSSSNQNTAFLNNVRKDNELPDPLVPFDLVESVKLISVNNDDESRSDTENLHIEVGLKDSEDARVVVIDPTELHQTSDFDLWMALRKNIVDVSASQLSVVLGTNYFTSRESLKQQKIQSRKNNNKNGRDASDENDEDNDLEIDDDDDDTVYLDEEKDDGETSNRSNSKACAWGIKMEPLAFAQYSEVMTKASIIDSDDETVNAHQNLVVETGMHLLRHTDPVTKKTYIFGASPDGMVTEHRPVIDPATNRTTSIETSVGLLEIKSLWGRRNKGSLPEFNNCPSRFYDQIQGQMAICDKDWCDLMLFIPPSNGSGGGNTRKNKRKGTSAKKRKKQAAVAAATNQRKSKGKNYCIVRVKRNEGYWEDTVLPALVQFCNEVERGTTTTASSPETTKESTTAPSNEAATETS
jgi:hypothetical protein